VDVDPVESPHFAGEVTYQLSLLRRTRTLELHAEDLRVSRPRIEVQGRRIPARLVRRADRGTLEVHPAEPLPAGEASLQLSFRGKLRSDLRGLYDARSGERRYAFTQLEAADARRFFPCFDEPSFKARFQISVTTGHANTVLSNAPADKIEPLGGGRKRVHFRPTPPLSTYLLALAVGELEASEPTF
jgi:aminopeptidase N